MKFKSLSLGVYLQAPPLRGRHPCPGQGDGKGRRTGAEARLQHLWGWTVSAYARDASLFPAPSFRLASPGAGARPAHLGESIHARDARAEGPGQSRPSSLRVGGGAPGPQGTLRYLAKARGVPRPRRPANREAEAS